MDSGDVGTIGEQAVILACLRRGWSVAVPVGDSERYDLIIDRGHGLERAQVKNVKMKDCVSEIPAYSSGFYLKNGKSVLFKRPYTTEEIDLLVAYCRDNGKVYVIDLHQEPSRTVYRLRFLPPKSNQKIGVRYAKDYEI